MLVKLGSIWVDPIKVSAIGQGDADTFTRLQVDGFVHVAKDISVDECAAIINGETSSSYGGANEESSKEV